MNYRMCRSVKRPDKSGYRVKLSFDTPDNLPTKFYTISGAFLTFAEVLGVVPDPEGGQVLSRQVGTTVSEVPSPSQGESEGEGSNFRLTLQ